MSFPNLREEGRPIAVLEDGIQITPNVDTLNFESGIDAQTNPFGSDSVEVNAEASEIDINDLAGVLEIAKGGTNNTLFDIKSIVYFDGTKLVGDSINFNFDPTNKYLGLGGVPTARLHVLGTTANHIGRFDIGIDFTRVQNPPAPTLTLLTTTGSINVGQHFYYVSYITTIGETALSPVVSGAPYVITDASHAQVQVTIPVSSDYRVIGRKIYRAVTGSVYYNDIRCVGTVNDNTTTTFIDNVADASRTGPNSYTRDNTTSRFITVDSTAAMLLGDSTYFGFGAGATALAGTSGGGYNTFVGRSAGAQIIGGERNTAVGYFALNRQQDGANSVALGDSAAGIATFFYNSIAIGRNAAGWLQSGYNNIFIGGSTGFGAIVNYQSTGNTAVGVTALNRINTGTTSTGYNAAFGYAAGENVSTGTYNTLLGSRNNSTTTTGSYNITIGAFVNPTSATASGQLNIGNVLYGTGLYQTASASSTPTTNGLLGIGIAPTGGARLELAAGTTSNAPLRLTAGTNKTTPVSGDIEYNGTHVTVTDNTAVRQTLVEAAFGYLYENNESGTIITITTAGDYEGWVSATSGGSKLLTLDTSSATADSMTVDTGGAGDYKISFNLAAEASAAVSTLHVAVFLNGTITSILSAHTRILSNDGVTITGDGILTLSSTDVIDLRLTSDSNGDDISVKHCSLTAHRINQ